MRQNHLVYDGHALQSVICVDKPLHLIQICREFTCTHCGHRKVTPSFSVVLYHSILIVETTIVIQTRKLHQNNT